MTGDRLHRRIRLPLLLVALLIGATRAHGQPAEVWRYFTSTDGLVETWVGAVSAGSGGQVWITHGRVPEMSAYDGFSVRRLPSPGVDVRVEEGPDRDLWAMEARPGQAVAGLMRLSGGKWVSFPVTDFGDRDPELLVSSAGALRFRPVGKGRVVYLARDGLRLFDSATSQTTALRIAGCSLGTIRVLTAARPSGFWIAGERGVGRVSWPPDDDSVPCVPQGGDAAHRLSGFSNLFDDGDGVLASALDARGRRLLVRASVEGTAILASTAPNQGGICGWPAGNGGTWVWRVSDGEHHLSFRTPDGGEEPAPKSKLLSGRLNDVAVQPNGVFWLAGLLGLARWAPPVWQTLGPPAVSRGPISGIGGTSRGAVFFLGVKALWILSCGQWRERPLPLPNVGGYRLAVLRDGRVALPTRAASGPSGLLVYDPDRDRFDVPSIAGQANCVFVGGRTGGRAWAACQDAQGHVPVFSYDGDRFEQLFEVPTVALFEWPRTIAELRDGSIWIGAFWPDSLYRYANGRLQRVSLPPEASAMGVSDIAQLPDGRVWVGGRGLLLEYAGSAWRVLRRKMDTVRAIYPTRDGSVWIASNIELMRCRASECVSMGVEEGLPEGAVWGIFEEPSGRLLVATTGGVRFREPGADVDPPIAEVPPKLNVASAAPGGEVQLVPAAMDRWRFTEAGRLLYSYRLDAGSWSSFEDRTVFSLQGIASGSHTLQVRAMDRNFNVGPAASHVFAVLAPWYRQPGLILIGGLAAAILVFSVRQHLNRHRELARLVESKTRQLASDFEERSRLQARFESILDHAPTLIYVKDLAGRYIVSSLRHREALGRTREEVIGRTDEEIFGAASGAFQPTELAALTENRVIQREDTDHRGPRPRTFLSITCPLYDSAGQPNAVCGISTDVTESKVLQERLQHSQRLEAIGMLAGGVAHDFNNLLTVIGGYAALLESRGDADGEAHDSAALIRQASERAAALTRQLLAFGRRQAMRPQVVDANVVVSELCRMLRRTVPETIHLRLSTSPNPAPVLVDPVQMEQVLMNLVLNARDAMPEGGELRISVVNLEQPPQWLSGTRGPCVLLRVADTGLGMDAETKGRVFEPFFTTKPLGQGTGLGMATVYGIVRQSDGDIEVNSAPHEGTTVDVYLPRAVDEAATAPPPAAFAGRRGDERILVVEDEPEVGQLTSDILTSHGYQVQLSSDPQQVLASHAAFDLLITDLVMPGIRGTELARHLMLAHPGIRVILVSGYADTRTDAERRLLSVAFLPKPYSPTDLLNAVRETLGKPAPAPPTPPAP